MDPLNVKEKASDRKEWRKVVKGIVAHIERRRVTVETVERSQRVKPLDMEWKTCGRVCQSRAGLANHMRAMHKERATEHKCRNCQRVFSRKTNLKTHEKKMSWRNKPSEIRH